MVHLKGPDENVEFRFKDLVVRHGARMRRQCGEPRDRFGARAPLRLGVACGVLSFALLAVAHARMWQFYAAGVLIGAGYGLSFAALGNLVVDTAGPADIGVAGGVNTIARTVGGAVGAQIAVAVLDAAGPAKAATTPGFPAESGYTSAFAVFALVACGALGASWAIPEKRHRVSSGGHQGRLRIPTD
ncbi:MFS transporter [Streptomyces sp. NBS 14/10]|uniref:MFS transporter n=1 Tax=Streptomyces sp. NBS 14/10 TaxID=1945643 RepID=UPI0015C5D669|nr:MFS transporter [Streptomyces sp. NBS 14/10]KAK1181188.1 MFS transporter [Streptomyces sp. NBS 14/10]